MKALIIGEVNNNELSSGTLEIISKAIELKLDFSVVTIGNSDSASIGSDNFSNTYLKSNSNKKLVIVGDVPYKDSYASNLKKMIDKRLIFAGYIKDQNLLAELYHNCFVYIHGHEFGGTNPTMIKAMAYGCAILALDTVFNQEMLQGKYGLFFSKEILSITSIIEYCEKENMIIDNLRKQSINGITKKYNWDFICYF